MGQPRERFSEVSEFPGRGDVGTRSIFARNVSPSNIGNKCSIIDRTSRTTLAVSLEDHGIYRLVDSGDSLERAFIAKSSALSSLWDQRYRHLNIQYLAQLAQDNLVHGLPDIQTQNHRVCGACQAGKQHRTPFKDGESWWASKVLQLVHADVCVPMNTPSVTGNRYLLFVDDFSRKMWVYLLKQKSNAFPVFQ